MWVYIDLDGTIIDVFDRYCGILNSYMREIDGEVSTQEYKELRHQGASEYDIIKEKYKICVGKEEYRKYKRLHLESREWLKKDKLIGNPERIKDFPNQYALITQRNNKAEAVYQIKQLGLDRLFDEIIILKPCINGNSKLEYLRGRAGYMDCIIGDSPVEMECARRLHMQGYYVKTGLFGEQIAENETIGKDYLACIQMIMEKR